MGLGPSAASADDLIRVAAVAQYVRGKTERVDISQVHTPVEHGTPIYENDRIQLGADAILKFVTRPSCVGVAYGPGVVLAAHRELAWRIQAQALRWICPEGAHETFVLDGAQVDVQPGSEVLVDGRRLLILRGGVSSDSKLLAATTQPVLFGLSGKIWSPSDSATALDLWNLNHSRIPPLESLPWVRPRDADRPIQSRYVLGPLGGPGGVRYDNSDINQNDLDGDGARLQGQWRRGERSLIAALTYRNARNSSQNNQQGPPTASHSSELDLFIVEMGYRTHHDRWWSPYYRAGVGRAKAKVQISRPDFGYYSRNEYDFYVVSAAGGIDVFLTPSWLRSVALYGGLEGQVIQSVARDQRKQLDAPGGNPSGTPSEAQEPWSLTSFGVNVMLGLALQF